MAMDSPRCREGRQAGEGDAAVGGNVNLISAKCRISYNYRDDVSIVRRYGNSVPGICGYGW